MELLQLATDRVVGRRHGNVRLRPRQLECLADCTDFRIETVVRGAKHTARCVLAGGHTNVEHLEKDGRAIVQAAAKTPPGEAMAYRGTLKKLGMAEVLALAETHRRRGSGVFAARRRNESGRSPNGVSRSAAPARQIRHDAPRRFLGRRRFLSRKLRVASAVDARMAGMAQAVMTSGGSGNQGIVAILTPYIVGREMGVEPDRILKSLAVSHLVNAYVKCFVGEISAICGCAMAAGIASAVAIVYQQRASTCGESPWPSAM